MKYKVQALLIATSFAVCIDAMAADTTPPITFGAHVSNITTNNVTVNWSTDEKSSGVLEYSKNQNFSSFSTAASSSMKYDHSVQLTGLTSGSAYYYRIRSKDAFDNEGLLAPTTAAFFSFTPRQTRIINVSNAGNDSSADGSESSPYKTLLAAAAVADPGDTIQFRANGVYSNVVVTIRDSNITLTTHPDDLAAGKRAHLNADAQDLSQAFVLRFDLNSHGGWIHDLEISGGAYYAIKTESNWNWGIADELRHGAGNLLIEDSVIHDSGRDAIKITPGSAHATIRRNEIYNTGMRDPSNADGIDNVNGDNMVVFQNHFHDISTNGLYPKGGARNALIDGNLIENCGTFGIAVGFYTDSEWFDEGGNPNFHENIDGIARNNIVKNIGYAGIGIYGALRPQVYNNTVIDAAKVGRGAITISPGGLWANGGMIYPQTVDAQVYNNIVVQTAANPVVEIREVEGVYAVSGYLKMDNNIYHQTGSGAKVSFSDVVKAGWGGADFAKWKTSLGVDASSKEEDPKLNANGKLMLSSPAIDAGFMIGGTICDYDGQQRVGLIDVGADEAGGVAVISPPNAPTNVRVTQL